MKHFLLTLALVLPLAATARKKVVDPKYLAPGAVPVEDGRVVFRHAFALPEGQRRADALAALRAWATPLVERSIEAPGRYARVGEQTDSTLEVRLCEWMVFKKKPLWLDRTRCRFQINATATADSLYLSVSRIVYYYNEDGEGEKGLLYKAEDWITDEHTLTRGGTRLNYRTGKFRTMTIDRVSTLFAEAQQAVTHTAQ